MGHFPYFLCKRTQRTLQREHFHCKAVFAQHRRGSTSHPQSLHFGARHKGPAPISQNPVDASSCDDEDDTRVAESSCVAVHFGVKLKGPAPGSQNPVDGSSSKGDEDDTRVAGARSVAGASCKAVRIRDADINSKVRSVCDTEVSTLSAKTLCCGLPTLSPLCAKEVSPYRPWIKFASETS